VLDYDGADCPYYGDCEEEEQAQCVRGGEGHCCRGLAAKREGEKREKSWKEAGQSPLNNRYFHSNSIIPFVSDR
jgi:hypothetical protein